MDRFKNYFVKEDENPNHVPRELHKRYSVQERTGTIGPFKYWAFVCDKRSKENRLAEGTIYCLQVVHSATQREVASFDRLWLLEPTKDDDEAKYVIEKIVEYYWNGVPKYTFENTNQLVLENRKKQLLIYWGMLESYDSDFLTNLLNPMLEATPEVIHRLECAFEHFLRAIASLDHRPESWYLDACRDRWEDYKAENDLQEESKEADHAND